MNTDLMAAKKCPNCNSECPVASNSCKKCLHVFIKSRKGSSTSSTTSLSPKQGTTVAAAIGNTNRYSEDAINEIQGGRRHTGRITRSKPNFYDSLHVEEQMKQQKLLLRKQMKQSKSDEDGSTVLGEDQLSNSKDSKDLSSKVVEGEPKKRRRGRPPGITGKKTLNAGRVLNTPNTVGKLTGNHHNVEAIGSYDKDFNNMQLKEEDIMADISPEKALQYNIVLDEINRKWVSASWKVS